MNRKSRFNALVSWLVLPYLLLTVLPISAHEFHFETAASLEPATRAYQAAADTVSQIEGILLNHSDRGGVLPPGSAARIKALSEQAGAQLAEGDAVAQRVLEKSSPPGRESDWERATTAMIVQVAETGIMVRTSLEISLDWADAAASGDPIREWQLIKSGKRRLLAMLDNQLVLIQAQLETQIEGLPGRELAKITFEISLALREFMDSYITGLDRDPMSLLVPQAARDAITRARASLAAETETTERMEMILLRVIRERPASTRPELRALSAEIMENLEEAFALERSFVDDIDTMLDRTHETRGEAAVLELANVIEAHIDEMVVMENQRSTLFFERNQLLQRFTALMGG